MKYKFIINITIITIIIIIITIIILPVRSCSFPALFEINISEVERAIRNKGYARN